MGEVHPPLSFRIMRLNPPQLPPDTSSTFDVRRDFEAGSCGPADGLPTDHPFAGRLHEPWEQGRGPAATLATPESFGPVYLGQKFRCCLVLCNTAPVPVTNISLTVRRRVQRWLLNGCGTRCLAGQSTPLPGTPSLFSATLSQVELHTERGPVILVDPRGAAALTLAAGAYHSVQIAHDIKEVGPHSLICSAVGLGEHNSRVAHSQSFRFPVTNPITVRSKVGVGGEGAGVCMGMVDCVPVSQKGYVRHQTLQVHDYIIHNVLFVAATSG